MADRLGICLASRTPFLGGTAAALRHLAGGPAGPSHLARDFVHVPDRPTAPERAALYETSRPGAGRTPDVLAVMGDRM
jgi:hypothetical protein